MIINPPSELNWIEITSMIASVITTIIAGAALVSWKQQKNYELKMEALAASRKAKGLITLLRNPVSFDAEIDTEIAAGYPVNIERWTSFDRNYLTFQSRLKSNKQLYDELYLIREKVWAGYSDVHTYYQYFEFVINIVQKIAHAHSTVLLLQKKEFLKIPNRDEEISKSMELILHTSGDSTSTQLETLYENVCSTRAKSHLFLNFWRKLRKHTTTSFSS